MTGKPTIFVVDDDAAVQDSLRFLLESADHRVETYGSGLDFLDNDHDHAAGCLILDLDLPVMSGLEVLEALSAGRAEMPVILDAHQLGRHPIGRAEEASDNPERRFAVAAPSNEIALSDLYEHLCRNYEAWFGNFRHFIDVEAKRAACHFDVRLTPSVAGLYANAGVQTLRNCNFFEFREDRIDRMTIYYANPQPGGAAGRPADAPTGYPPSLKDKS